MARKRVNKKAIKAPIDKLKLVEKVYEDPRNTGSYGSRKRLENAVVNKPPERISKEDVERFLKQSDSYTLHHDRRKHFEREKIVVRGIDKQWQADLADMSAIAKYNDGNRNILTVIDCFSKFAWAIPVKRKDSKTMVEAFTRLFEQSAPRIPEKLHTDKGLEFYNAPVKQLLKTKNIELFSSDSDMKAAMVERFNRTLKKRMHEYFTAKGNQRYMENLPDFLHSYNNTVHRTIGMAPSKVKRKHENVLFNRMYGKFFGKTSGAKRKKKDDIEVGQHVRISRIKHEFEKGYTYNWSAEVFLVDRVIPSPGRSLYKIKDLEGEAIKGTFYHEELLPITHTGYKDKLYEIDKVVDTRKNARGEKEHLVKYKGFPAKFNQWVNAAQLQEI